MCQETISPNIEAVFDKDLSSFLIKLWSLFGSSSPPVFISPISSCFETDEWHLAHQPSKGKKKPTSLSQFVRCFPFSFSISFYSYPSFYGAFWAITHLNLPSLIFPLSFSCLAPPFLSLKNLYSDFLFMLRWRFKDWRGFQNLQISQFLKLNIILRLEK